MPRGQTRRLTPLHVVSTVGALSAAIAFEHWAVHRGVVLPALETSYVIYPWMWAMMFVPELIVAFVTGWRLEGWREIAGYAALATVHRFAWQVALARAHEPGHETSFQRPAEFAISLPLVLVGYLVAFWLASESGHEPGPEPAGDR